MDCVFKCLVFRKWNYFKGLKGLGHGLVRGSVSLGVGFDVSMAHTRPCISLGLQNLT